MKVILVLLSLVLSFQLFSAAKIGRITKMIGTAEVVQNDKVVRKLKAGDVIYVGDFLKTGKRSFIKVLLKDDTLFQLGSNSSFHFETFDFQSKKKRKGLYNLIQGQLRGVFIHKAKEGELTVKTPTASMGIRGTEILSNVYKIKGKVHTDIALLSGKVSLKLLKVAANMPKVIALKAGQVFSSAHTGAKQKMVKPIQKKVIKALKINEGKGGQRFLNPVRLPIRQESTQGDTVSISATPFAPNLPPPGVTPILSAEELQRRRLIQLRKQKLLEDQTKLPPPPTPDHNSGVSPTPTPKYPL